MKSGEKLELTAGELAFGGDAVCREPASGMVVFVPFLAPGDRALVEIVHVRSNYARGRALDVIRPGADRVEPSCPVFSVCGGCHWQHVSLSAQRAAKERIVRHLVEPFGLAGSVARIRGTGGYRYRNRLILPVRAGRQGLRAGFFRAGTHRVVDVETCAVQRGDLWRAARAALALARERGVSGYNETSGRGVLRHLVVRAASGSGELGVVFVTTGDELPRENDFARELMRRVPEVVGVARNVNPRKTNVILSEDTRTLAGRAFLSERIGGTAYRASLPAFFQANGDVTEILVDTVAGWAAEVPGGVVDLYCGVGVLGLAARSRKGGGRLLGIEESAVAVKDAAANARDAEAAGTGPGEIRFEAGRVEEVLPRVRGETADAGTVIVDPPRRGLTPESLGAVTALGAPQLIYVSCDPATFSRDLKHLVAAGFSVEELVPLDMFPQTWHIELVARLRRSGQAAVGGP